ncbi:hypothetical protein K4S75_11150 [Staphylococcus epidermidis]|uniref:Lipoprotein n=1 Tax=Staphylococcus warneri TaxID=1292 RepID=A0A8B2ZHY5_STAWA|nr:hypothetical protein [Staphylococcus warneri]MCG1060602.1 hypothetical protein [Staphylococcus epidermidis]RGM28284.1 hypothetical protein DXC19_11375 [Staphylococcus warneri]
MNTKKWILIALTLLLTVSLAACNATKPERQKKTTEKGQMKVGEMMQEDKQHVWFLGRYNNSYKVDGDSDVYRILISKNGKLKVYYCHDITNGDMKDYAKMSDKEIIKKAKKEDKSTFDYTKKDLIKLTKGEIKETKKLIKEGSDYRPPATTRSKGVVYGYADYARGHQNSPEESLKKLKEYQKQLEDTKYEAPKSKKIDLHYDDENDLFMSVGRDYPFPKNYVAHGDLTDTKGMKHILFEQALQPKKYNGQRFAGVAEDGDKEQAEAEFLFLTTKVDDKVKNVLIDEKDDPAIKHNKPKKGEE